MVNHSLAEITKRSGHLFSSVLEAMRQQPPGPRTKTLIHEVAYLQEAEIPPKKRGGGMTNANVQLVNEYSEEWYQANQAPEEVGIVPIYRLSEAGDVKPQGDGIHMQVGSDSWVCFLTRWLAADCSLGAFAGTLSAVGATH